MLTFLTTNWLWILLIAGVLFMHMGHRSGHDSGHGGGCGGGHAGHSGHADHTGRLAGTGHPSEGAAGGPNNDREPRSSSHGV